MNLEKESDIGGSFKGKLFKLRCKVKGLFFEISNNQTIALTF